VQVQLLVRGWFGRDLGWAGACDVLDAAVVGSDVCWLHLGPSSRS
jgi:hypothetical protein